MQRTGKFNPRKILIINKQVDEVVLSPRPLDWSVYLAEGPIASEALMEGIEDLPVQEREV